MVVSEFCYVFSIILVLLVIWWSLEFFKSNKHLHKFPGPFPLPIIGNAHSFVFGTGTLETLLGFQRKYGGPLKIFFGNKPRVFLSDSKSVEFLLSSSTILEKSYEYRFLQPWLGTGLLTSTDDHWRRQRKLLTPTFHFQILEQFLEIFNVQSDVLIMKLQTEVNNAGFDIYPHISLCTLDVICESSMGTSLDVQNNPQSEYLYSVKEMLRIVMDRLLSPLKMWDLLFYFSKDYRKQQKALKILLEFTKSVIRKKRFESLIRKRESKSLDSGDTAVKRRLAFLDLLLECSIDGKPLPDSVIEDEVNTFMFEGHDTVASGISFTLYCLSKNPSAQDKIVEELRSIFDDDKGRSCNYQDLQNMRYLEMAIKESLRIYPSVPMFGRVLNKDYVYDGKIIPKGVACEAFIYGLHRQPDVFPEPEVFDPERFAPENAKNRSPFAYVPFSAGPRNCIGQRFAMLEMKSTLSKILKNYEFMEVPHHSPKLTEIAVLKSGNGLYLRMKRRNF